MPVTDGHLVGAGEVRSARVQRVTRFGRSAIAGAVPIKGRPCLASNHTFARAARFFAQLSVRSTYSQSKEDLFVRLFQSRKDNSLPQPLRLAAAAVARIVLRAFWGSGLVQT